MKKHTTNRSPSDSERQSWGKDRDYFDEDDEENELGNTNFVHGSFSNYDEDEDDPLDAFM